MECSAEIGYAAMEHFIQFVLIERHKLPPIFEVTGYS
jgi:hypothetical protein